MLPLLAASAFASSAFASSAFASSAFASNATGAFVSASAGQADPGPQPESRLPTVYAELAELRNSELQARVAELWSYHPEATFDALVLRAGRLAPPILSGNARAEREAARAEALSLVRARLAPEADPEGAWTGRLDELAGPSSPGAFLQLRAAALRLAGELGAETLGPRLAAALADERAELRSAARQGLFALHLRWFETPESYADFVAEHPQIWAHGADRATAVRYETLARERQVELLQLDPARAPASLADPDPRLRVAAARTLGDGVAAGAIERERAEELLFERLAVEEQPAAYYAVLDALGRLAGADPPGSASIERLRGALRVDVASVAPDLRASVARAIGRLPWSVGQASDPADVSVGLGWLALLLSESAREVELADPDGLVAILRAIGTLGEQAQAGGSELGATGFALNNQVMEFVESPRHVRRVRVAAALLLPVVVRPGDLERVDALLRQAETHTDLRYALVGALGHLARSLGAQDEDCLRAVGILAEEVRRGDTDLRRRALAPLLSDELAQIVAEQESERFVEWLEDERLPEMQSRLLELIRLHGDARDAEELLRMEGLDALAKSGPGRIGEIAAVLSTLSGDDADLRFRAAERLAAIEDEGSEVRRLREALVLVAEIPAAGADTLSPERHRAIVGWAERYAERGGVALLLPDVGTAFLQRLVDLHLARAPVADEERRARDAYVRARVLVVLAQAEPDPSQRRAAQAVAAVKAEFDAVLEFSLAATDRLPPAPVLRDRARYFLLIDDRASALKDYRSVLAIDPAAGNPALASALEQSDLRDAGALMAEPGTPTAMGEAFDLSYQLVRRPSWRDEAVPARMLDLQELVARAETARDLERLALAAELFASLPEAPSTPASTPGVEPREVGALGRGLIEDPTRHAELAALRERLAATSAALRAGPGTAPDGGDGEPSPGDGDDSPASPDDAEPPTVPQTDGGGVRSARRLRSGA